MATKRLLLIAGLLTLSLCAVQAQDTGKPAPHIYNPQADAQQDIKAAVANARKEGKHVLLQLGGNWCIWCIRFNDLTTLARAFQRR